MKKPTYFDILVERGLVLPKARELDDEALHELLWKIIRELGKLKFYLKSTNHMSDRDLYKRLQADGLREEMSNDGYDFYMDFLGTGTKRAEYLRLRYYLEDEMDRDMVLEFWEQLSDEEPPEYEKPPFNRDHKLPSGPLSGSPF